MKTIKLSQNLDYLKSIGIDGDIAQAILSHLTSIDDKVKKKYLINKMKKDPKKVLEYRRDLIKDPSLLDFIYEFESKEIPTTKYEKEISNITQKKRYRDWVRGLVSSGKIQLEDFVSMQRLLNEFTSLVDAKVIPEDKRDIFSFKDDSELFNYLKKYKSESSTIDYRNVRGSDIKYEGSNGTYDIVLFEIHTFEAMRELAPDTNWCVANSEDDFNSYDPPYYMFYLDGEPEVLIHKPSGQIKEVSDTTNISPETVLAIFPVMERFELTDFDGDYYDFEDILTAIEKYNSLEEKPMLETIRANPEVFFSLNRKNQFKMSPEFLKIDLRHEDISLLSYSKSGLDNLFRYALIHGMANEYEKLKSVIVDEYVRANIDMSRYFKQIPQTIRSRDLFIDMATRFIKTLNTSPESLLKKLDAEMVMDSQIQGAVIARLEQFPRLIEYLRKETIEYNIKVVDRALVNMVRNGINDKVIYKNSIFPKISKLLYRRIAESRSVRDSWLEHNRRMLNDNIRLIYAMPSEYLNMLSKYADDSMSETLSKFFVIFAEETMEVLDESNVSIDFIINKIKLYSSPKTFENNEASRALSELVSKMFEKYEDPEKNKGFMELIGFLRHEPKIKLDAIENYEKLFNSRWHHMEGKMGRPLLIGDESLTYGIPEDILNNEDFIKYIKDRWLKMNPEIYFHISLALRDMDVIREAFVKSILHQGISRFNVDLDLTKKEYFIEHFMSSEIADSDILHVIGLWLALDEDGSFTHLLRGENFDFKDNDEIVKSYMDFSIEAHIYDLSHVDMEFWNSKYFVNSVIEKVSNMIDEVAMYREIVDRINSTIDNIRKVSKPVAELLDEKLLEKHPNLFPYHYSAKFPDRRTDRFLVSYWRYFKKNSKNPIGSLELVPEGIIEKSLIFTEVEKMFMKDPSLFNKLSNYSKGNALWINLAAQGYRHFLMSGGDVDEIPEQIKVHPSIVGFMSTSNSWYGEIKNGNIQNS